MTGRRWWIVGLLFGTTVINYVDRQTLSILARTIQDDLGMSDLDYASVVQAFLLAYTIAYLFVGRITDLVGSRWGMTLFLAWWSVANVLTGFARSAFSLGAFRFLLGLGEAGNYTVAPKAVSEWMPPKDRGLAIGIYTAGATVGATIAPPLIAWMGAAYGWRAVFVITGALGLAWLAPWLAIYRAPGGAVGERTAPPRTGGGSWKEAFTDRRAWLLTASRMLTDPVWYFYLFWFPKYLGDARGLTLPEIGRVAWIVYLAADIGSVVGGWASGQLIRRGRQPIASRLMLMGLVAACAPIGVLIALGPRVEYVLLLASIVVFCQLTWQVTLGALVTDIWPAANVGATFGLIAAGSGLGGLVSTGIVGRLVTAYSYAPVFALMAMLHPVAYLLVRRASK